MAEHQISYDLFHDLHSQASISVDNLKTLFDLLIETNGHTLADGIPDIGLVVAKQGQAELDKIWDKMREGAKDGKED